jgi:hypothetical protein
MRTPRLHVLCFALVLGIPAAASAAATLVRVDGDVEIGSGAPPSWRSAKAGDAVATGELLRTGVGARAELRLGNERTARIYERSVLRIGPEAGGAVSEIELDQGASLFDLVRRISQGGFDVRTREIIVSVKGTRFLVTAAEGADSTSVFRGEVELAEEGFDTIAVRPGFTGSRGELSSTPFGDPWEIWASNAIAPVVADEAESKAELRDAIEKARETQPSPSVPASLDANGSSGSEDDASPERDGGLFDTGAGERLEAETPVLELEAGGDDAPSGGLEVDLEAELSELDLDAGLDDGDLDADVDFDLFDREVEDDEDGRDGDD